MPEMMAATCSALARCEAARHGHQQAVGRDGDGVGDAGRLLDEAVEQPAEAAGLLAELSRSSARPPGSGGVVGRDSARPRATPDWKLDRNEYTDVGRRALVAGPGRLRGRPLGGAPVEAELGHRALGAGHPPGEAAGRGAVAVGRCRCRCGGAAGHGGVVGTRPPKPVSDGRRAGATGEATGSGRPGRGRRRRRSPPAAPPRAAGRGRRRIGAAIGAGDGARHRRRCGCRHAARRRSGGDGHCGFGVDEQRGGDVDAGDDAAGRPRAACSSMRMPRRLARWPAT